jgi:GNAT superfamily N-acetyltransferase
MQTLSSPGLILPEVCVDTDPCGRLASLTVGADDGGVSIDDAYLQVDLMDGSLLSSRLSDDLPGFFRSFQATGLHGYLSGLEIPEALRGDGLGSAMLGAADFLLREAGVTCLWVVPDSKDAERFYRRFGFRVSQRVVSNPLSSYCLLMLAYN